MGVLLMLLTIGGLIVAVLLLGIAWLNQSAWLKKFVFGAVAVWFGFYIAMLLGFSFFSTETTLAANEPKEYCGFYFDCHMHTAVTGVQRTNQLGDRLAQGEFYVVTVRVSSDARAAKLGLLTVDAHVVDAQGRDYSCDMQAETQLAPQPDFEQKAAPGGSFEKEIVFDLPQDVQNPRLDIREGHGVDHVIEAFLVGDEDSIFHKRIYFGLDQPTLASN